MVLENNNILKIDLNKEINLKVFNNINTVFFQEKDNIIMISISDNNFSSIFNKIINIINIFDIQDPKELKNYLDDILYKEELTESILSELKLMMQKSSFTYEMISFANTEAGDESLKDFISSYFLISNTNNEKKSPKDTSKLSQNLDENIKSSLDSNEDLKFLNQNRSSVGPSISYSHFFNEINDSKQEEYIQVKNTYSLNSSLVISENIKEEDYIFINSNENSNSDKNVVINDIPIPTIKIVSVTPSTISSDDETIVVADTPSTISSNTETIVIADTAITNEDTEVTIDVLANDTDVDGLDATLSSVTNGTNGTSSIVSQEVVYTPNSGFTGTDTFTYTNSEGNTSSVSVIINAVAVTPITSLSNSGFTGTAGVEVISVTSQIKGDVYLLGGNDIIETSSHLHTNATLFTGDGDDTVTIGGIAHGTIDTGAGDDYVTISGKVKNTIDGGSGSDTILLEYYSLSTYTSDIADYLSNFENIILNDGTQLSNVSFSVDAYDTVYDTSTSYSDLDSVTNTGDLNDEIEISGNIKSKLSTSDGNDKVIVDGNIEATLNTGDDNDFVYTDGNLTDQGEILTSDGNDYVFIKGNSEGEINLGDGDDNIKISGSTIKETITGGDGDDSIYLQDIEYSSYLADDDDIQTLLSSFENIKFKDGETIGDSSVFDDDFFTSESTPLILDLDGDGIETLSLEDGVSFDINNDGTLDKTAWVTSDDALLVRDINSDGIINDASELFGEETIKSDGTTAVDGFDALSDLDSNLDGVINKEDEFFNELSIWQDENSDGLTQDGELLSLEEAGISEISLSTNDVSIDSNGNTIGIEGSYTTSLGEEKEIADVWFVYEEENDNETISFDNLNDSNNKIRQEMEIKDFNIEDYLDSENISTLELNNSIKAKVLEEPGLTNNETLNKDEIDSYDNYYCGSEESYIKVLEQENISIDTY